MLKPFKNNGWNVKMFLLSLKNLRLSKGDILSFYAKGRRVDLVVVAINLKQKQCEYI